MSLYERTFVAVLHFHFMTAYYDCIPQPSGISRRFLPFPNNHRHQSKVLCFSIFTTQPSISSLSQCPTDHESRRFRRQCRVNIYYSYEKLLKRVYIFVCTKINVYKIFLFILIYFCLYLYFSLAILFYTLLFIFVYTKKSLYKKKLLCLPPVTGRITCICSSGYNLSSYAATNSDGNVHYLLVQIKVTKQQTESTKIRANPRI